MSISLCPYNDSLSDVWDAFIKESLSGTFLHSRRFISYHGERFVDRSLIAYGENAKVVALFPAALLPSDSSTVVSHPGLTYGGLVVAEQSRGERAVELLQLICNHYKNQGIKSLHYKAVPLIYHRVPNQDDLYALFRLGAVRYRCDLTATIDLSNRGKIGSRRKRGYKKAVNAEVVIESGSEYAENMWGVLSKNLLKHNAQPVHTIEEILMLHHRFPENIRFAVAKVDGEVVAGVVIFQTETTAHAQYIAASEKGYAVNALDLLFENCIIETMASGKRYFDFGISNENQGQFLNEGLYNFKLEFGAGSCVHEFYEINLF